MIKKLSAMGAMFLLILSVAAIATDNNDLSNYPDMFIKNGQFDGYIVVGNQAAAEDVVGAIDIGTGLQYHYLNGETAQNIVIGDVWPVETQSDKLELTEKIRDVKSYVGKDELDGLKDGKLKNNKGSFEYEQELVFSDSSELKFAENDDDKVADFVVLDDKDEIATYTLNFKISAESDIDDTTLKDFQNEKLEMLGEEYTITDAKYYGGDHIKLVMMGGAIEDILGQNQERQYEIGDIVYNVEPIWIGFSSGVSKVKFVINGETTDSLMEGESYTLKDGTKIGIREILEEEAGEVSADQVEFYLGVQKIVLEDTDMQDSLSDKYLKAGEETLDNTKVIIKGTEDNGIIRLDSISLVFHADEDVFLGDGQKLSDVLKEPEGLLNWDLRYEGLTTTDMEDILVKSSGDDSMIMKALITGGTVQIPLAYSDDANHVVLGDEDDKLVLDRDNVEVDQYFILTDKIGQGGRTYILQYKGSDVPTSGNPIIKFKDIATGEIIERSIKNGEGTLSLGGEEYTITNTTEMDDDDFNIKVTGGFSDIITSNGALISITDPDESDDTNQISVSITYVDDSIMDEETINPIVFNITDANDIDEIAITKPSVMNNGFKDDDTTKYINELGAEIEYEEISGPDELRIKWPKQQRYGQLFVTIGAAKTEIKTDVKVEKIQIPTSKLDTEITNPKDYNLIVIGGPCANKVTSELLGIPQTSPECYEDFVEGKAMIKSVTNGDNVAIIVAGLTALDTRRAALALRNFEDFELTGDEVLIVGTSLNDISVTHSVSSTSSDIEVNISV